MLQIHPTPEGKSLSLFNISESATLIKFVVKGSPSCTEPYMTVFTQDPLMELELFSEETSTNGLLSCTFRLFPELCQSNIAVMFKTFVYERGLGSSLCEVSYGEKCLDSLILSLI